MQREAHDMGLEQASFFIFSSEDDGEFGPLPYKGVDTVTEI